jgi:hypothetical protein
VAFHCTTQENPASDRTKCSRCGTVIDASDPEASGWVPIDARLICSTCLTNAIQIAMVEELVDTLREGFDAGLNLAEIAAANHIDLDVLEGRIAEAMPFLKERQS